MTRRNPPRGLIVTADDFGLSIPVNEAIERGHNEGILTTASLMVGAPATDDAVARARRLSGLRVGLHLVLVNGRPVLPRTAVQKLVGRDGELPRNLAEAGMRFFFTPGIRRQLEAEIRAQFAAFAATGLVLDHVNAQNHMHVHPTILGLILKVGREFGLGAVRIPREPLPPLGAGASAWRQGFASRLGNAIFLAPWLRFMELRLRRAGIAHNDAIFGLNDTGRMTVDRVLALLSRLPSRGVTEMYFHPATRRWPGASPEHYAFEGEFAALVDPAVAAFVDRARIPRVTFGALASTAHER